MADRIAKNQVPVSGEGAGQDDLARSWLDHISFSQAQAVRVQQDGQILLAHGVNGH